MPENKLNFEVSLTAKDIFAFQTQLLLRRSKIIFILFGVSYILLLFTLVYSYISTGKLFIVTTIIAVTLPFALHLLRRTIAKKTLNGSSLLLEKQRYTMDAERVSIAGESTNTSFELKNLKRISITKKLILLWQTNTTANIIPIRSLTAEQFEQLKKMTEPFKKTRK